MFEPDVVLGNDENAREAIAVFPNPTSGQLVITSATSLIEEIAVFDVLGRQVSRVKPQGVNHFQLDMSALKTALYFVEISTEQGKVTKRIVKE